MSTVVGVHSLPRMWLRTALFSHTFRDLALTCAVGGMPRSPSVSICAALRTSPVG